MRAITEALEGGNEVQITGFGKFYVRERKAREGGQPADQRKDVDPGLQGSDL